MARIGCKHITEQEYKEAEARGIGRGTVKNRYWSLGWSKYNALNKPLERKRNTLTDEEKRTLEENGISKKTYHQRLRVGWTKERAMTEPINEQYRGL